MTEVAEVSFVPASQGWEVLYYFKGGRFETAPIIAWGIHAAEGTFARAIPVTADMAWTLDEDRAICTPDGDVTLGDIERWPTVWAWLEDMQRRETDEPGALPPEHPPTHDPFEGNAPLVLANFRRKFQKQEGE
jgi:hypothetical protein